MAVIQFKSSNLEPWGHEDKEQGKAEPILYALLAAIFYAVNTPLSKLLLDHVAPTFMAAFLYLGAGLGVGVMYLFHWKNEKPAERLAKKDLPYTLGMIVLDILAPIFLMLGIAQGNAANASLLGNFEIVATAWRTADGLLCSRSADHDGGDLACGHGHGFKFDER